MPETAPIFIGGVGRSGSTLLRVILDSHPNIYCGPEIRVLAAVTEHWKQMWSLWSKDLTAWNIKGDDIDRLHRDMILGLFEPMLKASGKNRVAEKSPNNAMAFGPLHHLFPESPIIHVTRHPFDVIASLLERTWIDLATGKPMAYTENIRDAARYWAQIVTLATEMGDRIGERYIEVKYEDLVSAPEPTLKDLFERIGEPWDPCVLEFYRQERDLAGESSADQVTKPIYTSAVGRGLRDLSDSDRAEIATIIHRVSAEVSAQCAA